MNNYENNVTCFTVDDADSHQNAFSETNNKNTHLYTCMCAYCKQYFIAENPLYDICSNCSSEFASDVDPEAIKW